MQTTRKLIMPWYPVFFVMDGVENCAQDLPEIHEFNEKTYNLLGYVVYRSGHFTTYFVHQKLWYFFDDLKMDHKTGTSECILQQNHVSADGTVKILHVEKFTMVLYKEL
jgi:hypothetical protein